MWKKLTLLALAASQAVAQAPNTVAKLYPDDMTQAANGTWLLIPVEDAQLADLVKPYKLLPVPSSDASLYPHGFPAGHHPVLVYSSYNSDIRQTIAGLPAYIERLLASQVIAPYVDRLGDGKTAFSKTITGYIGGADGQTNQAIVPALVGTLASAFGYPLFVATMDPDSKPWAQLDNGKLSIGTKEVILPNPVSGPGISPSAIDLLFSTTSDPQVSPQAVKVALNQPAILPSGQCQYNNFRFNETFSNPVSRDATVTLYSPAIPQQLSGNSGPEGFKTYSGSGVGGFSGTAEQVGYPQEACAAAAARVIVV